MVTYSGSGIGNGRLAVERHSTTRHDVFKFKLPGAHSLPMAGIGFVGHEGANLVQVKGKERGCKLRT